MASVAAEPISPELCLVCPELRALAFARLEADAAPVAQERLPPLSVQLGAYLAVRTTQTATECGLFAAGVTTLVFLLSFV